MGSKIANTSRYPNLGLDRTTERNGGLFCFPAIAEFNYAPDDMLFVFSGPGAIVIPPENPDVGTALAAQLKEASLLKPAHVVSFPIPIY
jgi:hypothetical protein